MVRKILLALKHDNLIIENALQLAENPEITRSERSNFYNLKAKLLEIEDVWNQGTANTQIIYGNVELIGLLQGSGFRILRITKGIMNEILNRLNDLTALVNE